MCAILTYARESVRQEYFEEMLEGTNKFFYPTIALAVIMLIFTLRWLYVFHYFTLEGCSFMEKLGFYY